MGRYQETRAVTYCLHWDVRVEVSLKEQDLRRLLRRHRLNRRSSSVTKDCGVEAIFEADVTEIRVGSNPVVIDRLVGSKLKPRSFSINHKHAV